MKKVFKYLGHNDHGISKIQIDFIQNHPDLLKLEDGKLIRSIIKVPNELGRIYSALYGPNAGDDPIKESDVFYAKRGNRMGETRFIRAPLRQVSCLCVIGVKSGPCLTIYGTQSTKLSPIEPWDKRFKRLNNKQKIYVLKFWKQHALAYIRA